MTIATFCLAVLLAGPHCAARVVASPPALRAPIPPHVTAALALDGAVATASFAYNDSFAVRAVNLHVPIGNTSILKSAYYVQGDVPFSNGYALGYVTHNETEILATTYIDHIVISLLDEALDEYLQNSSFAPVYDVLLVLLTDLLVSDSMKSFNVSVDAGAIPPPLIAEMEGIVAGVHAANASTAVDFAKIATLNFGYDFLLGLIYTGESEQMGRGRRNLLVYLLLAPRLEGDNHLYSGVYVYITDPLSEGPVI